MANPIAQSDVIATMWALSTMREMAEGQTLFSLAGQPPADGLDGGPPTGSGFDSFFTRLPDRPPSTARFVESPAATQPPAPLSIPHTAANVPGAALPGGASLVLPGPTTPTNPALHASPAQPGNSGTPATPTNLAPANSVTPANATPATPTPPANFAQSSPAVQTKADTSDAPSVAADSAEARRAEAQMTRAREKQPAPGQASPSDVPRNAPHTPAGGPATAPPSEQRYTFTAPAQSGGPVGTLATETTLAQMNRPSTPPSESQQRAAFAAGSILQGAPQAAAQGPIQLLVNPNPPPPLYAMTARELRRRRLRLRQLRWIGRRADDDKRDGSRRSY